MYEVSIILCPSSDIIVPYKVTKYRRTKAFKSAVRVLGLVLGLVQSLDRNYKKFQLCVKSQICNPQRSGPIAVEISASELGPLDTAFQIGCDYQADVGG